MNKVRRSLSSSRQGLLTQGQKLKTLVGDDRARCDRAGEASAAIARAAFEGGDLKAIKCNILYIIM